MTVEALIARLEADAQARIAALHAQADAEVAAIEAARERAATSAGDAVLAARRARRHAALDAERAVALRRAAADVLRAQHALLDRIFARAAGLAAEADSDPRFVAALPRQVAAVLAYLGGRPATLVCRGALVPQLRPLLADAPHIELVTDDTLAAGMVAVARDGSCTVDATLPGRLTALRPGLEARLAAELPR